MSDADEAIKKVAERVKKDKEALARDWATFLSTVPMERRRNPEIMDLMQAMFETGWQYGIMYMAKNPLWSN